MVICSSNLVRIMWVHRGLWWRPIWLGNRSWVAALSWVVLVMGLLRMIVRVLIDGACRAWDIVWRWWWLGIRWTIASLEDGLKTRTTRRVAGSCSSRVVRWLWLVSLIWSWIMLWYQAVLNRVWLLVTKRWCRNQTIRSISIWKPSRLLRFNRRLFCSIMLIPILWRSSYVILASNAVLNSLSSIGSYKHWLKFFVISKFWPSLDIRFFFIHQLFFFHGIWSSKDTFTRSYVRAWVSL